MISLTSTYLNDITKASITRSNVHADKSHTGFGNRFLQGKIGSFSARTSLFHGISPDISSYVLQSDSSFASWFDINFLISKATLQQICVH